jgi:hypothetical protein
MAKITFYNGHLLLYFIVFDILMAHFHLLPRPLAREIMALQLILQAPFRNRFARIAFRAMIIGCQCVRRHTPKGGMW